MFNELKAAGLIPTGKGALKKADFMLTGSQAAPDYSSISVILGHSVSTGHTSELIAIIEANASKGGGYQTQASEITGKLEAHKALEDELKECRDAIKSTEKLREEFEARQRQEQKGKPPQKTLLEAMGFGDSDSDE